MKNDALVTARTKHLVELIRAITSLQEESVTFHRVMWNEEIDWEQIFDCISDLEHDIEVVRTRVVRLAQEIIAAAREDV